MTSNRRTKTGGQTSKEVWPPVEGFQIVTFRASGSLSRNPRAA
jgi:hypothetical protein